MHPRRPMTPSPSPSPLPKDPVTPQHKKPPLRHYSVAYRLKGAENYSVINIPVASLEEAQALVTLLHLKPGDRHIIGCIDRCSGKPVSTVVEEVTHA